MELEGFLLCNVYTTGIPNILSYVAQNKVMSELRHKHTQSLEDLNTEREKVKELHKQLHIATETQTTMLKANNELQQKVKEVWFVVNVKCYLIIFRQ